jgi:phosphatidylglycerol:prolipoprotein diacylglycerol transferase
MELHLRGLRLISKYNAGGEMFFKIAIFIYLIMFYYLLKTSGISLKWGWLVPIVALYFGMILSSIFGFFLNGADSSMLSENAPSNILDIFFDIFFNPIFGFATKVLYGFYFGEVLGLIFIAFLASIVFGKNRNWYAVFLDTVAFSLMFGFGIVRINCFIHGCCYGIPCNFFGGVVYPPTSRAFEFLQSTNPNFVTATGTVPLLPTQLISSIGDFSIFLALFIIFLKKKLFYPGFYFFSTALCYGTGRFCIEFFRIDPREFWGPLSMSQWISLVLIVISAIYFVLNWRKIRENFKNPKNTDTQSLLKEQNIVLNKIYISIKNATKVFFSISSDSYFFLVLWYLITLIFKVLVSLQYIFTVENHTPLLFIFPFSILLASFDFIFFFLVTKLCDLLKKPILSNSFHLIFQLFLSFVTIYAIGFFYYFRNLINFGILKFVNYSSKEKLTYYISSINFISIFVILCVLSALVLSILFVLKKNSTLKFAAFFAKANKPWVLKYLFCFSLIAAIVLSSLPVEKTLRLNKNVLVEIVWSYLRKDKYIDFSKQEPPLNNKLPEIFNNSNALQKIEFNYFEETKGKNIILIVLESTSYEHTTLGGDHNSKLTFVQTLADKSLVFANHRTLFPATTRSLLMMVCSDYPGTDYSSITSIKSFDCPSIFDAFRNVGYSTLFFSPVQLDYDNFGESKIVKNFDYIFEPTKLIEAGKFKKTHGTDTAVEEEIVQADFFDKVLKLKEDGKPFFALYFPYWTHSPYEHPFKSSFGMNPLERYRQSQEYENEKLTEFFERLEKENLLENSIVVFTSDHGEAFGRKPGDYVHPNYLFDENLHIPFLIYIKGITDKETNGIYNPTTVLDVAPTIAKLAGVEPFANWKGSFMFDGVVYPAFIYTRASELHNGILYGNNKFFYNLRTDENYLFNLVTDPLENNNLIDNLSEEEIVSLKHYLSYQNYILNKPFMQK